MAVLVLVVLPVAVFLWLAKMNLRFQLVPEPMHCDMLSSINSFNLKLSLNTHSAILSETQLRHALPASHCNLNITCTSSNACPEHNFPTESHR